MTEFCAKCGKPLLDGATCDCESTNHQEGVQQQEKVNISDQSQAVNQKLDNFSVYLKNILKIFKAVILTPNTEGVKYIATGDRQTALGILGIQAIFTTLFALIGATQVSPLLNIIPFLGGSMRVPFGKIFIVTIIVSFALSIAFSGIIKGISYLFKNKITFDNALCITAVRSLTLIPVTIVACVIALLNLTYGIMLFYAGNLAAICYMVITYPCTTSENKNKVPMIVFVAVLIFAIVSLFIMGKCLPFYVPDSMKDVTEIFSHPSGVISDMMGGW